MVRLSAIRPNPNQPRRMIDENGITRLSESIKQSGLIQPMAVRPIVPKPQGENTPRYELIAGERRWRAAKRAGLSDVPVLIREVDEAELLQLALVENIQRENLNPIDRAMAYRQFVDQFGMTPEEVGKRVGEDRSTITNYIRLLDLPAQLREMVARNLLTMGHARALLGLTDDSHQLKLAQQVVVEGLSVRDLERIVRSNKPAPHPLQKLKRLKRPLIRDLEERLEHTLKTRVQISEGRKKGRGKIVIEYHSLDQFDSLCKTFGLDGENQA
jgi:ParB family chromosome partitioning protein